MGTATRFRHQPAFAASRPRKRTRHPFPILVSNILVNVAKDHVPCSGSGSSRAFPALHGALRTHDEEVTLVATLRHVPRPRCGSRKSLEQIPTAPWRVPSKVSWLARSAAFLRWARSLNQLALSPARHKSATSNINSRRQHSRRQHPPNRRPHASTPTPLAALSVADLPRPIAGHLVELAHACHG